MAQATPKRHFSPQIFDNLWRGLREGALWISLLIAVFLLVALFTYSPSDPGWTYSFEPGEVHNAGGLVGAYVANVLLSLFGWLAYLLPLLLAYGGWLVYREHRAQQEDHERPSRTLLLVRGVGLLLVVLAATGLLTTHVMPVADAGYTPGGILGSSFHGVLVEWFNRFGASLLLLGLLVSGITLLTELSWFWVMDVVGALTLKLAGWLWARIGARFERFREQREQDDDYGYADPAAEAATEAQQPGGVGGRVQALREGVSARLSGVRGAVMRKLGRRPEEVPEEYWDDASEPALSAAGYQPPLAGQPGIPATPGPTPAMSAAGVAPVGAANQPFPPLDGVGAAGQGAGYADAAALAASGTAMPTAMSATEPAADGLVTEPFYAEARQQPQPQPQPQPAFADAGMTAACADGAGDQLLAPMVADADAEPDSAVAVAEEPTPDERVEPTIGFPWLPPVEEAEPTIDGPPVADASPGSPGSFGELPGAPGTTPTTATTPQPRQFDAPPAALTASASAVPLQPVVTGVDSDAIAPLPTSLPTPAPRQPTGQATAGLPAGAVANPQPRPSSQTAMPVQAPPPAPPKAIPSLPSLALLDPAENIGPVYTREALEQMSRLLEEKLGDFRVTVQVVAVHPGPVITRFEMAPAPGVKVSRITNLSKDIARSMLVSSVRVVEVIPGKSTIGLEIPNHRREIVRLSEVFHSPQYDHSHSPLSMALGKDIGGKPVVVDLAKMPHLLVAGTTGSGKSVAVNAMILSLLFKARPDEVRLIMIDPKMLELSIYDDIPHLLAPVVTDMKEAAHALRWCVVEMERRYQLMAAMGVRNLKGFNTKIQAAIDAGDPIPDPLQPPLDGVGTSYLEPLPYIVVVVDELADLMMVVGKKIEELIARLAQKARAAGLHLILATQRPSVDVITGLIKANIPTRIAFQVSSRVDSRTILDQMGAEALLGMGDMLYLPPGTAIPVRVHGAFVDDHEVHNVVEELKANYETDYLEGLLEEGGTEVPDGVVVPGDPVRPEEETDVLYDDAVRVVTETRRASVSGVQRRLRIGYNRAARLVESMESAGVVGPLQGNGSREVLAPPPVEL